MCGECFNVVSGWLESYSTFLKHLKICYNKHMILGSKKTIFLRKSGTSYTYFKALILFLLSFSTIFCWHVLALENPDKEITRQKVENLQGLIYFFDWPDWDNDAFCLGILGDDPFGEFLDDMDQRRLFAMDKVLNVKRFGSYSPEHDLASCQMLYISPSEKDKLWYIVREVAGKPVLTVSEIGDLAKSGIMLNMFVQNEKVNWEVNLPRVHDSGLKVDSQFLRNAAKVRTFEAEIFGR